MNEQENVQLIRQIFMAFGEGNMAFLLDSLADDVEWYVAGSPDHVPLAGIYHGRDQVANVFQTIGEFLELHQFQPQEFVVQDERVVVLGSAQGRIRSTNCAVKYDWVHHYTLHDGKIIRFREYLDTAAIAAALRSAKEDSVVTSF